MEHAPTHKAESPIMSVDTPFPTHVGGHSLCDVQRKLQRGKYFAQVFYEVSSVDIDRVYWRATRVMWSLWP